MISSISRLVVALVVFAGAVAQQIGNPSTQQGVIPPRGTFAIRNARIVTVSGPDIENGTVVIRDGKIEAVGTNVSVPAWGANNRWAWSFRLSWNDRRWHKHGTRGSSPGANGTVDTSEVGELNPNAKAIIAVNPHSAHIAMTRVEGVTLAYSLRPLVV